MCCNIRRAVLSELGLRLGSSSGREMRGGVRGFWCRTIVDLLVLFGPADAVFHALRLIREFVGLEVRVRVRVRVAVRFPVLVR